MSYYLDMGFTTVKDKNEAFQKANQFAQLCGKNYKEMLDLEKTIFHLLGLVILKNLQMNIGYTVFLHLILYISKNIIY